MNDRSQRLPLFVYGTLRPGERNFQRFLAEPAASISSARIRGELWQVDAEDYPYLCPGTALVRGELIHLRPDSYAVTLAALDRLEDFLPYDHSNSLYLRRAATALSVTGGETLAWTYLWNRAERPGRRLPTGDFRARRETSEG